MDIESEFYVCIRSIRVSIRHDVNSGKILVSCCLCWLFLSGFHLFSCIRCLARNLFDVIASLSATIFVVFFPLAFLV